MPVEEAYRIRTGESGEETLQAHPGAADELGVAAPPSRAARTSTAPGPSASDVVAPSGPLECVDGAIIASTSHDGGSPRRNVAAIATSRDARCAGTAHSLTPGARTPSGRPPVASRVTSVHLARSLPGAVDVRTARRASGSVLAGAGLFAAHDLALGVHARGDGLVDDLHGEGAAGLGAGGEPRLAVEAGRDAVGERVVAGLDRGELPLEGLGLAAPSAGRATTCSRTRRCRPWAPGRGSRSAGWSRPGGSRRTSGRTR